MIATHAAVAANISTDRAAVMTTSVRENNTENTAIMPRRIASDGITKSTVTDIIGSSEAMTVVEARTTLSREDGR